MHACDAGDEQCHLCYYVGLSAEAMLSSQAFGLCCATVPLSSDCGEEASWMLLAPPHPQSPSRFVSLSH